MAVPNDSSPPSPTSTRRGPVTTTIQFGSSRVTSTAPQKHELFNSFLEGEGRGGGLAGTHAVTRRSDNRRTRMLRGFATISFWADDLEAAKQWYTELLGIEPYFERAGYCEFRVGDSEDELGLIDSRYAPGGAATGPPAPVPYWHVDAVAPTLDNLRPMGPKA